jgi:diguanylate cyclase (GGDEF)-like protein
MSTLRSRRSTTRRARSSAGAARRPGLAVAAIAAMGDGVAVVQDGRVVLANRRFHELVGTDLPKPLAALAARGAIRGSERIEADVALLRPARVIVEACPLSSGAVAALLRVGDAASAPAGSELAALAAQDPLTGLPNRRAFVQRLGEEVMRAHRHRRPLSLAALDLDHFKRVNDGHGHPAGDRVLAETARRLAAVARPGDMVARLGGEEFAWVLPEADADQALAATDRARAALAAEPFPEGIALTASVGLCRLGDAPDADGLYRLADQALYWAKAHGRDMTLVWTPEAAARLAEPARDWPGLLDSASAVDIALGAGLAPSRRHGPRVAHLAAGLAAQLDWDPQRQARLHQAGRVHDAGKVALPESVLAHSGPLSPTRMRHVRQHAAIGAAMAGGVLTAEQVTWIGQHHERWDGTGYPHGLRGEAIAEGAQLLGLADAFEAMTSRRPYRAAMRLDEALAEVDRCAGAAFRPDAGELVRSALAWLELSERASGRTEPSRDLTHQEPRP